MRYLTKTSLLATGLAFALTGAALAQGTASTACHEWPGAWPSGERPDPCGDAGGPLGRRYPLT
ncbi:MAG: hypothetical protein NTX90_16025 [Alphaproteobacteria bacterium]|nr:hypothetical protein [Alphaproteobacteria bacterium]